MNKAKSAAVVAIEKIEAAFVSACAKTRTAKFNFGGNVIIAELDEKMEVENTGVFFDETDAFALGIMGAVESALNEVIAYDIEMQSRISFVYKNVECEIKKDLSNAYSTNKHYAASFYRVAQAHKKGYSMGGEDLEMLKALYEAGIFGTTNELKADAKANFVHCLKAVSKYELTGSNIAAYLASIENPTAFSAGSIEIAACATKSGNPEVYFFDYSDFVA